MRYIIKFSYDGSQFCGFATQPHKKTVQDEMEKCLSKICKEKIIIFATSRTDKNVHALVQYACFSTKIKIPRKNFKKAVNFSINKAIKIIDVIEDYVGVNPRYDCVSKTYAYRIIKEDDLFMRKYAYFHPKNLDTEKMKLATHFLVGTKDFSSVCSSNTGVKSKVRTVNFLSIRETSKEIVIEINADGFLYNMVRIIVGNLISVGESKITPLMMQEIIEACDRKRSFKTAPGCGLYLKEIFIKGISI